MPTTSGEIYDGVSAFLGKLLNMIEDERTNHLITWSKDGNSFIIPDQLEFAKVLLPKYYKHNNMASFIRQLNMYGFHKVISTACCTGDRVEFLHPYFVRGRPHLLKNIKRKMTASTTREFESNSVWKLGNLEKLISEVRDIKMKQQNVDVQLNTIKQENEILWREVSILRHKHKEQQELVNRVIRFLLSLAHASNDGYEKRKFTPLMIKDSRFNTSDREPHSDHQYGKYSSSPGPIIHELHPDILDDRRVIEVSSTPTIEIDSEMISSPSSTLSSSPKMIDSGEAAVKVSLNNNDMADEETTTIYLPVKIPTKSATSSSSSKQESIQVQAGSEPYVLASDASGAGVLLDLVDNADPNTEYITICLSPSEIHGNSPEPQATPTDLNEMRLKRRKTIVSPVASTTKRVSRGGSRGIRLSRTKSGICVDRVKPRSTPLASRTKKIARSNQITADTPIIIDNSDIEHLENDDTEYFIDISDLQQAISAQQASKSNNDEAVNVSYKKPIRVVSTWPIERPQPKGAGSSAVQMSSGSTTTAVAGLERLRKQVEKERKEPTAIPTADISDPVNQLNKLLASPASNEISSTSRSNLFDKQTASGGTFSKEENEALLNLVVDGDSSSLLNYFKDSAAKSSAVVSEIDSILSNRSITATAKSAPSPVNTNNSRLVIANSDSLNQLLESSNKFPASSGVLQSSSSKTQDLGSQLGASVPATNEIYNLTGISSGDNSNIFADVEKSVSAYQQPQSSMQNASSATASHVRSAEPTLATSASSDMSVALNDYSINNYSDRYNKLDLKEISNNLSSVQADLDNLKDLIKREGIQVDYSSILGLNSDDSNEYNNFSSDLLSSSPSSTNKSRVEGNELVSCNSPFNNVDLMDFNDWINWSLPVTPQSADQLSTITDTGEPMLNTPQPISYYSSSPGGEKRIKKS